MNLRSTAGRALLVPMIVTSIAITADAVGATTPDFPTYQDKIGAYTVTNTCNFKKRDFSGFNDPGNVGTYDVNVSAMTTPSPSATGAICEILDNWGRRLVVVQGNSGGSFFTKTGTFTATPQRFNVCVKPYILAPDSNQTQFGTKDCMAFG